MQLTNIARDVGEDALEGRLYLPLEMMEDEGLDPDAFLAAPKFSPALGRVVSRLLAEANRLYYRSEPGIAALPMDCRPGIFAARHIYDGIGKQVRRSGFNSMNQRARTNGRQKLGWLALSVLRSGVVSVMPRSAVLYADPLPEVAFLVNAAARQGHAPYSRTGKMIDVFAQLEARDRQRA